jgi:hypothetical protein
MQKNKFKASVLNMQQTSPKVRKIGYLSLGICAAVIIYIFCFLRFIFSSNSTASKRDLNLLKDLIALQNQTIDRLRQKVKKLPSFLRFYDSKDIEKPLFYEKQKQNLQSNAEKSCEAQYGFQLVEEWHKTEETWCQETDKYPKSSSLKCYPYHQLHKQQQGKPKDMFCVAENFVIDFSQVSEKYSKLINVAMNIVFLQSDNCTNRSSRCQIAARHCLS